MNIQIWKHNTIQHRSHAYHHTKFEFNLNLGFSVTVDYWILLVLQISLFMFMNMQIQEYRTIVCLNKKETGTSMAISLKLDKYLYILWYYQIEWFLLFPTFPWFLGSITSNDVQYVDQGAFAEWQPSYRCKKSSVVMKYVTTIFCILPIDLLSKLKIWYAYWTFLIVFNIFSSTIFYSGDEIVTMSNMPKFSNKTPVAKKLDHFA